MVFFWFSRLIFCDTCFFVSVVLHAHLSCVVCISVYLYVCIHLCLVLFFLRVSVAFTPPTGPVLVRVQRAPTPSWGFLDSLHLEMACPGRPQGVQVLNPFLVLVNGQVFSSAQCAHFFPDFETFTSGQGRKFAGALLRTKQEPCHFAGREVPFPPPPSVMDPIGLLGSMAVSALKRPKESQTASCGLPWQEGLAGAAVTAAVVDPAVPPLPQCIPSHSQTPAFVRGRQGLPGRTLCTTAVLLAIFSH